MSALIAAPPAALEGDIIAPGVGLTLASSAFGQARRIEAPAGMNILELLEFAGVPARVARRCVVLVGDAEIPKPYWERVRPKPGRTIVVGVRPADGDGGSNPLRVLLQIAVMVVSTVLMLTGNPVAAALVSTLGNLAINALFPPPQMQAQPAVEPTYAIESSTNELRLFGPVPVVLGRRRMVLLHAAKPYTEVVGDDLHLRVLLTAGVGPASLEDIRIGATLLSTYDDVQIELRTGAAGEQPITLFPNIVIESNPGVDLIAAEGWQSRETEDDATEISLDWTFPAGLVEFADDGGRKRASVQLQVRYRRVGESDWIYQRPTPDMANDAALAAVGEPRIASASIWGIIQYAAWKAELAGYAAPDDILTYAASDPKPMRRNVRWAVPTGKYEVQARRVSTDASSDRVSDLVQWTALRTIRNAAPKAPPGSTLLAAKIRASGQLQGQLEPISAIVTSIRPAWDGADFAAPAPTRRPADLFLAACKGPGNPRPQADSRIDFQSLRDWAAICAARDWTCDLVIDDGRSIDAVLQAIAACGRARAVRRAGKIGVVVDVPRAPSGQAFTPRNTRNFRAVKTFVREAHAIRAQFANEEEDYRADERIVYAPGYSAENAELFETLALEGIVRPGDVHAMTSRFIAMSRARAEKFYFEMDLEHAATDVGAVADLSHDVILEGLASARVIRRIDADGAPLDEESATTCPGVELDDACPMASAGSYALRTRKASGSIVHTVETEEGFQTKLYFTAPPALAASPAPGDLVMFGVAGEETMEVVVRSKGRPDANRVVELVCEAYAHPLVDEADDPDAAPDFTTTITRAWRQLPTAPVQTSQVWLEDGVVVGFSVTPGADRYLGGFEVSWRRTPGEDEPDSGFIPLPDLAPGDRALVTPPPGLFGSVDVRIRAYDIQMRRGPALTVTVARASFDAPSGWSAAGVTLSSSSAQIPALRVSGVCDQPFANSILVETRTHLATSGTRTSGSAAITAISSTGPLAVGMAFDGPGIPPGAVIASIDSGSQVTLSVAASSSGVGNYGVGFWKPFGEFDRSARQIDVRGLTSNTSYDVAVSYRVRGIDRITPRQIIASVATPNVFLSGGVTPGGSISQPTGVDLLIAGGGVPLTVTDGQAITYGPYAQAPLSLFFDDGLPPLPVGSVRRKWLDLATGSGATVRLKNEVPAGIEDAAEGPMEIPSAGDPVIQAISKGQRASSTTSHPIALPGTINAGDLLLVFFTKAGAGTGLTWDNVTAGAWTVASYFGGSATHRTWAAWKIASGGEDGATLNIVSADAGQSAYMCYRISGADAVQSVVLHVPSAALVTHPNLMAPWGSRRTLWLAVSAVAAGAVSAGPGAPWSSLETETSAGAGGVGLGAASRAAIALEMSGAIFTLSGSLSSSNLMVCVKPLDTSYSGPTYQCDKAQALDALDFQYVFSGQMFIEPETFPDETGGEYSIGSAELEFWCKKAGAWESMGVRTISAYGDVFYNETIERTAAIGAGAKFGVSVKTGLPATKLLSGAVQFTHYDDEVTRESATPGGETCQLIIWPRPVAS